MIQLTIVLQSDVVAVAGLGDQAEKVFEVDFAGIHRTVSQRCLADLNVTGLVA